MLARTVAHTVDVDGMLDGMTPQQFDEWMAMFTIRPWGIEPAIEAEEKPDNLDDSLNAMRRLAGV
jgi:hypothetical protein